jgi:hypothetical protein
MVPLSSMRKNTFLATAWLLTFISHESKILTVKYTPDRNSMSEESERQ